MLSLRNIASLCLGLILLMTLSASPSFAQKGMRICGHIYQGKYQDIMVVSELSKRNGNYEKNCKKMRKKIGQDLKNEIDGTLGNPYLNQISAAQSMVKNGKTNLERKVAKQALRGFLSGSSSSISPNAGGIWTDVRRASCEDVGNLILGWRYDICSDGMKASAIAQIIVHKCLTRTQADTLLRSLDGDKNRLQRQDSQLCARLRQRNEKDEVAFGKKSGNLSTGVVKKDKQRAAEQEYFAVFHQKRLGMLKNMTIGSVANGIRKDVGSALNVVKKETYKVGDQVEDTYDQAVDYVDNLLNMLECQLIVEAASIAIDGSASAISSLIGQTMSSVPIKLDDMGVVSKMAGIAETEVTKIINQEDFSKYLSLTDQSLNKFMKQFKDGLICKNKGQIINSLRQFDARNIKADNGSRNPLLHKASFSVTPAAASSSGEWWQSFGVSVGASYGVAGGAFDFVVATNFKNDVVITIGPSSALTATGAGVTGGADIVFGFHPNASKSDFSGAGLTTGLASIPLKGLPGNIDGDFAVQLDYSINEQPVSGFSIAASFGGGTPNPPLQPYGGFSWAFPM